MFPPLSKKKLALATALACLTLAGNPAQAGDTVYRVYLKGLTSPAALSISPSSLDFGNVNVGQSATANFVVANTGGTSVSGLMYLPSPEYTASGNCGTSLAAGQTCTETVTFTPTGAGSQPGTFSVQNGEIWGATNLTGFGLLSADQASLASMSFGNQAVGSTSAAQSVELNNTGNTVISISSVKVTGPFASTTNCGSTLAVEASCTANVTFSPTTTGSANGTLSFATNTGTQAVSLTGTGQAAQLSASPTSIAFGNVGVSKSTSQSITLSNTGNIAATSLAITVPSWLTYTTTCGTSLAANGTCTVSLGFTPSSTTSYSGNVQVTSSGNTLTVPATGTGICVSGNQAFTSNGTFTPTPGCSTYLVLVLGGGGGGGTMGTGGGGSGYVNVSYQNNLSSAVSVVVGAGGAGAPPFYSAQPGGQSCFGSVCVNGGGAGTTDALAGPGANGGSGGGPGSSGGTSGAGGSNGSNGSYGLFQSGTVDTFSAGGTGQGAYSSYLAMFTQNSLTAAPGGAGATASNQFYYAGGGGGGGVYFNSGGGPAASGQSNYGNPGAGGRGWGAGGGAGGASDSTDSAGGGNGAGGLVYIEWSK